MRIPRTACHALFLAATVAACLAAMTRAEARSCATGHRDMAQVSFAGDGLRTGDFRKVRLRVSDGTILHPNSST